MFHRILLEKMQVKDGVPLIDEGEINDKQVF